MKKADLIARARGEKPVDLLLRNTRLVNVFSGEIHPADIAVWNGTVVGFGPRDAVEEIDLEGRHVCPGFIDAHVHLESAMVHPAEFARAVLPRGTTAVVCDPHEIANVMGAAGVRALLDASRDLPLSVYVMIPSCVPATAMETAGAELSAAEIAALYSRPRVIGLAEMMNVPGVLFGRPEVLEKLEGAGERPVDGHAPGLRGADLDAYIAAGVQSDHEEARADAALEKLRRGMRLMIREGSGARNLSDLLPVVTEASSRRCLFCTDDRHPETLLRDGHIDDLVRQAIGRGVSPVTAVRMASLNPAEYFGLRGRGGIGPGMRADLLVLEDLETLNIAQVYAAGRRVAENGRFLLPRKPLPPMTDAVRPRVDAASLDFRIPAGTGPARAIGVIPGQILTENLRVNPRIEEGEVRADPRRDLLKIAVIERHRGSGRIGLGLVRGTGLRRGAIASSVAHDSHNIVVIGADDASMRFAVSRVVEMNGGQTVVEGERERAACPLPIAGLMSDAPLETVRDQVRSLTEAARSLGCRLSDPLMTMSFLALPVIPALKLTDRGLVDVEKFAIVPLFGD